MERLLFVLAPFCWSRNNKHIVLKLHIFIKLATSYSMGDDYSRRYDNHYCLLLRKCLYLANLVDNWLTIDYRSFFVCGCNQINLINRIFIKCVSAFILTNN